MLQLLCLRVKLVQQYPITHWRSSSCLLTVFVTSPAAVLERTCLQDGQCYHSRTPPEKGCFTKCYQLLHGSPQQEMFRNGMHHHLTLPCSGIQLWAEKGPTPPAHLCPCFSYSLCQREEGIACIHWQKWTSKFFWVFFRLKWNSLFQHYSYILLPMSVALTFVVAKEFCFFLSLW